MEIILSILVISFGLCLGSFVHLAISRFSPHKTTCSYLRDITFVRSKCPCCQKTLALSSLIPVVSWLNQKGRCRYCLSAIPIHYLITEMVISIFCLMIFSYYGLTTWSVILFFLGIYFTILSAIDINYLLLPNAFTYPLIFMGLLTAYLQLSQIIFIDAIIGMLSGYLLLWLPSKLYYLIKKQSGLGGGDIKLLSALGTWLHFSQLPLLLIFAAILGITYLILLRFFTAQTIKNCFIPFGPCLLIPAYVLLLLHTEQITR